MFVPLKSTVYIYFFLEICNITDGIEINADVQPFKPDVTLPITGDQFTYLWFKKPLDQVILTAAPLEISNKTQHASVYFVEIEFKWASIEMVTIILRNRFGGIVPTPNPAV